MSWKFLSSKLLVFLVAAVLGPFACMQSTSAQDKKENSSPLSVTAEFSTSLGAECPGGEGLVAHLHYSGEKPLRGYLAQVAAGSDHSPGIGLHLQMLQEARDSREPIAKGADWARTVCWRLGVPKGDFLGVLATVDVLKFDDGSIWGPARLAESHELIGMIEGMDFLVKTTDLLKYVSPIPPDQGPHPLEEIQFLKIGPLRFETGIWRDEKGTEMLAAEATNVGANPIRGYVFTESFFDPVTGNRLRQITTKELETQGNSSDFLAPGATWVAGARKFSRSADGTLARYTITLDLVVFADGSRYGPKRSQESDEVLGMFRGIDAAGLANQGVSTKPKS